ncbi:hypothetical protein FB45DRAFT_863095 [Roridomyces roridus]|uniref:Uncharacterized protein n=1 Tax=Roridomyces roridus TaxID=1738132 RepID=A0AAD7FX75_9AGAR|nr:hypothetical protein FB45DRAFT_863095 [Roridomyces roridus]
MRDMRRRRLTNGFGRNTEAMAEFAEKLQPTETGWDLQKSDDSERILPFSQRPTMTREKAVGNGSDGDQRGLGSKVRIKTDIWKLLHKWGAGMVYHLLCNPAEILVILPRASFVRGCPVCLLMVSKHHPNAIHYAPWMRDGENQLKCRSSIDMAVCRDADQIGSMFGTSADHGMFDLDSLIPDVIGTGGCCRVYQISLSDGHDGPIKWTGTSSPVQDGHLRGHLSHFRHPPGHPCGVRVDSQGDAKGRHVRIRAKLSTHASVSDGAQFQRRQRLAEVKVKEARSRVLASDQRTMIPSEKSVELYGIKR